jgi:proline utilization trans-activator
MIRDEDIDVPYPSMDGLTALEKEDFHDPSHINAQLQLAKITGNILNDIYRIPQPGRANTFVQSVQRILKSLWSWRETLPPILRFNQQAVPMYSSRSVASLHLNFSQVCIFQPHLQVFTA